LFSTSPICSTLVKDSSATIRSSTWSISKLRSRKGSNVSEQWPHSRHVNYGVNEKSCICKISKHVLDNTFRHVNSAEMKNKQWKSIHTWLFSRPPNTCLTILSSSKDEGFPFDLGSRVQWCKLSNKQRRNSCASSCCPGIKCEDNSSKSCQGTRHNWMEIHN
jgi:hypothetical protein